MKAFIAHNFEPQFEQLHQSFSDSAVARQMIYRLIRSAGCVTFMDWKKLKHDIFEIFALYYSELFTEKEILLMFADEVKVLQIFPFFSGSFKSYFY